MWQALIKLVEKMACGHSWEEYYTTKVYKSDYDKRPYHINQTLICSKCGKIKKVKV